MELSTSSPGTCPSERSDTGTFSSASYDVPFFYDDTGICQDPKYEAIRGFNARDNIECHPVKYRSRDPWEYTEDFDERLDKICGEIERLRGMVKMLAMNEVGLRRSELITDAVADAKALFKSAVADVHALFQKEKNAAWAEVIKRKTLKAHNTIPFIQCFKDIKAAFSSSAEIKTPYELLEITAKRNERLSQLSAAVEKLEKHRAVLALSYSEVIWNLNYITSSGRVQGHVWTAVIHSNDVTMIEPGVYNVKLKWIVHIDATSRPTAMFIRRRLDGTFFRPEIDWVFLETRTDYAVQLYYPIEVTVRDDAMCQEYAVQGVPNVKEESTTTQVGVGNIQKPIAMVDNNKSKQTKIKNKGQYRARRWSP